MLRTPSRGHGVRKKLSDDFQSTELFGRVAFPLLGALLAAFLVGDWCLGIAMAAGVFLGLYVVLLMFNGVEQGQIDRKYKNKDRNKQQRSEANDNRRLPGPHFRQRRRS